MIFLGTFTDVLDSPVSIIFKCILPYYDTYINLDSVTVSSLHIEFSLTAFKTRSRAAPENGVGGLIQGSRLEGTRALISLQRYLK